MAIRNAEKRLYRDDVLKRLPDIDKEHPLYEEWQIRKHILQKLITDLSRMRQPTAILDLGCGNGWMTNRLSDIALSNVFGVDLNQRELEQAAKVFAGNSRVAFIYGNIFEDIFASQKFDVIVLASCIQYFPSLSFLIARLLTLLKDTGEIHIIDSPLYTERTVEEARNRTKRYYQKMGYPEMSAFYFHHLITELKEFHPIIRHNPKTPGQRIKKRLMQKFQSPFYWIQLNA